MGLSSNIAEIIQDVLVFTAVMTGLLVVFIIAVSMMPRENPLKRLLTGLTYRLGATVLAGLVAIPIEPIPFIDALYDLGVPIALIWYWFTFLRDAGGVMRGPPSRLKPPNHLIKSPDGRGRRRALDVPQVKGDRPL